MIKLIALDLDGTLLSDNKTVCEANKEAIKKAIAKEIKVVLCSGRSQQSLAVLMEELELNVPGQYGIALNGAIVFAADSGKIMASSYMDDEAAKQIIRMGVPMMDELNIQLYTDDNIYVQRWDETTTFYEKVTHTHPVVVEDLTAKASNVIKMSYFQRTGKEPDVKAPLDGILDLKSRVEDRLPEGVVGNVTAPYLLEFLDEKVDKGVGMDTLGKILGINKDEMMAVGDLENDLSMIRYAGIGVAMKNGAPAVKEAADYITERTNNEGGVAEVIEKFAL